MSMDESHGDRCVPYHGGRLPRSYPAADQVCLRKSQLRILHKSARLTSILNLHRLGETLDSPVPNNSLLALLVGSRYPESSLVRCGRHVEELCTKGFHVPAR